MERDVYEITTKEVKSPRVRASGIVSSEEARARRIPLMLPGVRTTAASSSVYHTVELAH